MIMHLLPQGGSIEWEKDDIGPQLRQQRGRCRIVEVTLPFRVQRENAGNIRLRGTLGHFSVPVPAMQFRGLGSRGSLNSFPIVPISTDVRDDHSRLCTLGRII